MNSEEVKEKTSFAIQLQKRQIKFAIICIFFSGLAGVFFREFGRAFSSGLSSLEAMHATLALSQTHGHLLNIGFLVPLGLALITFFVKDKLDEKDMKKLNLWFTISMIAGIGTILLLFYKGIHFVVYSSSQFDFSITEIDDLLYGGSKMIRAMLNAIFHTSYGGSILLYTIPILKSLKKLK
ncbi:DUF2871 family protein [Promethearchaeum syntrophicum]|uniref:DUF2871 family protein n=1 Tax=Promethearchaeum syntrophicum TaxID=2594042 RepID=A0A5B9D5W9_9ARCH|nr:DUF2871 family protein [Candidatus Prometheoarchaeum syntrophicum]QEE14519.1 hypothetical protein DSAG12_00332 [Candidatus Prometheoarchaeum syntrophicum]